MNPDERCPECSGEVVAVITHVRLPCHASPFAAMKIACCCDCGWMTVKDWDRAPIASALAYPVEGICE